ncbi:MAG: hypothetical protein OEZ20_01180 [candidate division WOR-3 bacterium]|nr:hypothetical protein [candidate division WOR-3 bacterium]
MNLTNFYEIRRIGASQYQDKTYKQANKRNKGNFKIQDPALYVLL